MKPKDLLAHLEKGDRTMHYLTKKPAVSTIGQTFNTLFQNVYGGQLGQIVYDPSPAMQLRQGLQQSTNQMWQGNNTTTGSGGPSW